MSRTTQLLKSETKWLHAIMAYAYSSSAVSKEATGAREAARSVIQRAECSHALFGSKLAAIAKLRELARECAKDDWDGQDSKAIKPEAALDAELLVRFLPESFPIPEFAPEPDGSISLDWIKSRHRVFSVSLNGTPRCPYAWLNGGNKGHGVLVFTRERMPFDLTTQIRSLSAGDSILGS